MKMTRSSRTLRNAALTARGRGLGGLRRAIVPALAAMAAISTVSACSSGSSSSSSNSGPSASTSTSASASASAPAPAESASAPAKLQKVSVVTDLLTTVYTPLYTAEKLGIFEKHGLDVEINTLQSGSTITQVMQSGSVNIAASGAITQALAVAQGAKFVAIASEGNASPELCVRPAWAKKHDLTAASSVQDIFAAFKGARVGVTGAGGTPDLLGKYLISTYGGLDPETDVTTIALGSSAGIATAFKQGSIDANLASAPQCETLVATGDAEILLRPSQIPAFNDLPYAVIYANASYIDGHPDIAKAFAASIVEAEQLAHSDTPKIVSDVLQQYFPTVKAETLTNALNDVIVPQMPKDGRMTQAGWDKVVKVLSSVNNKPLDTSEGVLWTNKYLPSS